MTKNRLKSGFTLAEILVTLGIIGIIAAITIPTLITKYQKYQTAIQLKAAYAILGETISYSIAQNGDTKYWKLSQNGGRQHIDTYILPYVPNIMKTKHESAYVKYKENAPFGTGWIYYADIKNGLRIIFRSWGRSSGMNWITDCGTEFVVDLNGNKRPNKWGRDLFLITLETSSSKLFFNTLYRINWESTDLSNCSRKLIPQTRDEIKQACIKNPAGCGALIYYDNFKITEDYPW